MASILLLGKSGYVGAALYKELSTNFNFVIGVDRQTVKEINPQTWDIVINCAMPSARFRAQNHPGLDFSETVVKTADFYHNLQYDKFVQISSVSARTENTIYGRHKLAAESIIDQSKHLIFRLTATYDESQTKGVVFDLINNNLVYVSNESRYSFASLDYVVRYISSNLSQTGVREVGGFGDISLKTICGVLKIDREFKSDYIDRQIIQFNYGAPSASGVIDYIKEKLK
jgi:nucleoside-diphosphate-sugar epimerase